MSLVADRKGNIVEKGQDRILKGLYGTVPGRFFLKLLVSPAVSKLAGAFLDSGLSRALIPGFVRRHSIDMAQFEPREYQSYNDFFTRKLAKGARTLDSCPGALVSPCDSRVSVYPIDGESGFPIKNKSAEVSLERETRFEPATSTLARWRSTTEPFPHINKIFRTFTLVEVIGLEPMTLCL